MPPGRSRGSGLGGRHRSHSRCYFRRAKAVTCSPRQSAALCRHAVPSPSALATVDDRAEPSLGTLNRLLIGLQVLQLLLDCGLHCRIAGLYHGS